LLGLLKLGRFAAGLTEKELYQIAKLMTQSSADLLEEWFETDALKGTKAASGIIGTFLGPRSPGTAYVLLHHYMGEIDGAFRAWGFAKGGSGGVSGAIASAAQALGAEIRVNAGVSKVIVKGGRAVGSPWRMATSSIPRSCYRPPTPNAPSLDSSSQNIP